MDKIQSIFTNRFFYVYAAFFIICLLLTGLFSPAVSLQLSLLAGAALILAAVLYFVFYVERDSMHTGIIVFLTSLYVLLPPFRLPEGIPDILPGLLFVFLIWAVFLFYHLAARKRISLGWNSSLTGLVLIGLAVFLSIAHAALFLDYHPVLNDWFELLKPVQYILILLLAANLNIRDGDFRKIYIAVLIIFSLSVLFGFAQYLNLFNMNNTIMPHYTKTQLIGLLRHQRILGTTANPNEFAALMVMAGAFALSGFLYLKKRLMRIVSAACFAAFSAGVMLTLSRTGLVVYLISCSFVFLWKYPFYLARLRKMRGFVIMIIVMAVIFLAVFQFAPDMFFVRMESGLVLEADRSWQIRMARWDDALAIWQQSPVFGWGPGKGTMTTIVDSEWLLLLRRYGIFGVTIFMFWFAGIFSALVKLSGRKMQDENDEDYLKVFCISLQAIVIACLIYMFPVNIYHSMQLMPVLMILTGLVFSKLRNKKVLL